MALDEWPFFGVKYTRVPIANVQDSRPGLVLFVSRSARLHAPVAAKISHRENN